ncbi:transposase, partial [Micromonospora sp. NPDC053740]|uniref:transposase n=1 Tax=Micromonospora sp. NPDC053740 TaxID=3155173 RepID=UPI00342BB725
MARRDKDARFTALLHHVSLGRLRAAYWAIRPQAAAGVDGVTWAEYGRDLEVTDSVVEEMEAWRQRPLDRIYPVVFIDALVM